MFQANIDFKYILHQASNWEYSEAADVDPQIQAALKKMNKLDTALAKKLFKERAIKKQGKDMRAKLWEELQVRNVLPVL